ncbi:MAG: transposase [Phycisphaerales bacterium JB054]
MSTEPLEPHDHKTRRRYDGRNHARALNFCCYQNRPFLRSERACVWFCDALRLSLRKHPAHLWAFCIMPDHVHLLLFPEQADWSASGFLSTLKQSVSKTALAWMEKHASDRFGLMQDQRPDGRIVYRFWQRGGGFDRNLWSPGAIWEMIDYIHLNPVRAGFCPRPQDWRWSSARAYFLNEQGEVKVDRHGLPARP